MGLPRWLPLPTLVTKSHCASWGQHLQVSFFLLASDPEGERPELPLLWGDGAPRVTTLPLPPNSLPSPPEETKLAQASQSHPSHPLSLYPSAFPHPHTLSHQAETSCRGWRVDRFAPPGALLLGWPCC